MTVVIEFDPVLVDAEALVVTDHVVIVTGGKGEKGDIGDPGAAATLHAELYDLATSGHPATVISTAGPAGWTTAQQAIAGLHALAVALDAADDTEAATRALADTDLAAALVVMGTTLAAADAAEATARAAADTAEIGARNTAISTAIAALIDNAPELLNTLAEIAAALGDDDDALAALVTAINARATQVALAAEETRALTAEAALDDALVAETTRATITEDALVGNINAVESGLADEITRATDAEAQLGSDIGSAVADETARAEGVEADLVTAVASAEANVVTEETRALAAEDVLDDAISTETSRATAAEASNTTAVALRATTAALTSESTTRASADTALGGRVTTIESATIWRTTAGVPSAGVGINGDHAVDRSSGLYYLKTAGAWALTGFGIADAAIETTRATAAEGVLTTAVAARALTSALTTETSRATAAEGVLTTGVANAALASALTTETARATAAEAALTATAALLNSDDLSVGESIPRDRSIAHTSYVQTLGGSMYLIYFTARRTETVNNVEMVVGNVAQTTATLCRCGVYSLDGSGNGTLVASIANDTSLWLTTFTAYPRALSASWSKVAGTRYAFAVLCVSAGTKPAFMGPFTGNVGTADALLARAPRMASVLNSQTDLPGSFTVGSIANNRLMPSFRVYP